MDEDKQLTVYSLYAFLKMFVRAGYGEMPIFLGNDTPLMDRAITVNYLENKFKIRSMYYDRAMADATEKMTKRVNKALRDYISECCDAGIIEELEENENGNS